MSYLQQQKDNFKASRTDVIRFKSKDLEVKHHKHTFTKKEKKTFVRKAVKAVKKTLKETHMNTRDKIALLSTILRETDRESVYAKDIQKLLALEIDRLEIETTEDKALDLSKIFGFTS